MQSRRLIAAGAGDPNQAQIPSKTKECGGASHSIRLKCAISSRCDRETGERVFWKHGTFAVEDGRKRTHTGNWIACFYFIVDDLIGGFSGLT
jgi:hypothetical protein